MSVENLVGFKYFDEYLTDKTERFFNSEKNFRSLFEFMFSEKSNVFAEFSDGFRIKKITYGECEQAVYKISARLSEHFTDGGIIGIYMENSIEWIEIFWAILMSGNRPLLLNTKLDDKIINKILTDYNVTAVISSEKEFAVPTFNYKTFTENLPEKVEISQKEFGSHVIFMSSGTTENVKLCAYTGENFYHQVCDSAKIIKTCPQIKADKEGNVKLLTLLPFYHVFGFIAVYTWFGFYSRTFVFLKDLLPQTIQNTIKRHGVTHIFAVPLVWESVYKSTIAKIRARGEKTFKKFKKALSLSRKLGDGFRKKAFKEIRENLFGDSVKFMISGGSFISKEVLSFFNGIGYSLTNGYGMTEIGITSVELSPKASIRNLGSVGEPFSSIEYKINDNGELLVKSKSRADEITVDGKTEKTNYDEFFNTHDIVRLEKGRYFISGRFDDLIICENGENLNPQIYEQHLKIDGCQPVILSIDGTPTLLIGLAECPLDKVKSVNEKVLTAIKEVKLESQIKKILFTNDKLLQGNDFKLSRKKIAKRITDGQMKTFSAAQITGAYEDKVSALEQTVIGLFANALKKDASEISVGADFFTELGGSSLDYFVLLDDIKVTFNTDLPVENGKSLSTVKDICEYLKR